jgi:hypothetical protein
MLTSPAPTGATVETARPHAWRGNDRLLRAPLFHAAVISAIAFVVLVATAPHGLWLDEAISVRLSALPFGTLARFIVGGEPNMALFHLLLWPVAQLHPSDGVLRLLPSLAAALALGGTYVLGSRIFDRPTAAVGVALLVSHGLSSRYANEVRGYSLLVLLTVVCALALVKAVASDSRWAWRVFTVCAVLALATHFVAMLTIGAQLIALLVVRDRVHRARVVRVLLVLAAAVTVFGVMWIASNQDGRVAWIPALSRQQIIDVGTAIGGGSLWAMVAVGGLAAFASVRAVMSIRQSPSEAFPETLLVSMAWVPLAAGLVVSAFQPLFLPRYFLAVLPPLALLAARGLFALPRRPVLGVAVGVMVIALLVVGHPELDRNAREGTDGAVGYVLPRLRDGDAVFLPYNEELPALQWYGRGLPANVADARPDTPSDALTTDWWWEDSDRFGADLAARARLSEDEWRTALTGRDRIWVMSGFLAQNPRFFDTGTNVVPEGRVECDRQYFDGIDVVLWARDCP